MQIKKYVQYTLIYSFGVSVIGSVLLIGRMISTPDLGYFIFFSLILAGDLAILYLLFPKIKINSISISLLISYGMITFGFILNTKEHVKNILFLLIILVLINISLIIDNLEKNSLSKLFYSGLIYIPIKVVGAIEFFAIIVDKLSKKKVAVEVDGKKANFNVKQTITVFSIVALVGCPLFCCVLYLLSASSTVYSEWIGDLISFDFKFVDGVMLGRLFFIFFFTLYLISEIVFVKHLKDSESKIENSKVKIAKDTRENLGYATFIIVLFLNAFYLLFIAAELKYDFRNLKDLVAEKGLNSFSSLAVARFWELIIVTFINIFVVYFGRRFLRTISQNEMWKKFVYANSVLLLINTLFLIFSVHQRLYLYISTYGFTHKRFDAYFLLPVLLFVAIMVFGSIVMKNHGKLYSLSFGAIALYFSVLIMLPTTFIINYINIELAESDKIERYDPIYLIRDQYGSYGPGNDINDHDGLLLVERVLKSDKLELTEAQKKALRDELSTCCNEDKKLREFNIMYSLIY